MNHRVKMPFDSFVVNDQEHLIFEKALYSLLDKFKEDRIQTRCANYPMDFPKNIEACFNRLKIHENYRKNKRFFEVEVPENEVDSVLEILGVTDETAVA